MKRAVALFGTAAAWLVAPHVLAQVAAGVDTNLFDDPSTSNTGGGVVGRLGYRFGLPRHLPMHFLIIQPEAAAGYAWVPTSGPQARLGDVTLGGRVGVLGFLCAYFEPFFFARYGIAFGSHGPLGAAEVGAAFDWRLPWASIGIHAGHTRFDAAGTSWPYFVIGPHFEARWFP